MIERQMKYIKLEELRITDMVLKYYKSSHLTT